MSCEYCGGVLGEHDYGKVHDDVQDCADQLQRDLSAAQEREREMREALRQLLATSFMLLGPSGADGDALVAARAAASAILLSFARPRAEWRAEGGGVMPWRSFCCEVCDRSPTCGNDCGSCDPPPQPAPTPAVDVEAIKVKAQARVAAGQMVGYFDENGHDMIALCAEIARLRADTSAEGLTGEEAKTLLDMVDPSASSREAAAIAKLRALAEKAPR